MKKSWMIAWTLGLVVLILFFIWRYWSKKGIHENEIDARKNMVVFSQNTLDSLLAHHDYVLLTIGFGECQMCDVFRKMKTPKRFPLGRYYIDALDDEKNMLVFQSLYFSGFPLSYVMGRDYQIIGFVKGCVDFWKRLDALLANGSDVLCDSLPGVDKGRTLEVLSDSFRGMLHFWGNDYDKMQMFAVRSLKKGSYLFNNYLMYKYHEQTRQADSLAYYREKVLACVDSRAEFFYESLIQELGLQEELLKCGGT